MNVENAKLSTASCGVITQEDLLNAQGYNYDSVVLYTQLLRDNTGVKIGDQIPLSVIGEAPADFLNSVFTQDGREIEVEEFELYLAARLKGGSEVFFFALDDLDDEE